MLSQPIAGRVFANKVKSVLAVHREEFERGNRGIGNQLWSQFTHSAWAMHELWGENWYAVAHGSPLEVDGAISPLYHRAPALGRSVARRIQQPAT